MRFYTNIQYRNNDILVREIDGDDVLKYRDSFQPTLYLAHNKKLKLNDNIKKFETKHGEIKMPSRDEGFSSFGVKPPKDVLPN